MPDFQTFTRSMLPLRREAAVTLHKRGIMSMNRAAFVALEMPAAVELLFDRGSRIIGLRAVDPRSETAHFVRMSTPAPSGPFVISAMAFFKVYGIEVPETRRWPAHLADGVLCVDLTGESMLVRRTQAS